MEVRRVKAGEWRLLRDLRLRALEDAPEAFATRYEDAVARPEEWWVEWAARSAEGDAQAMLLGADGESVVGLAGTFVDEDRRWLISMWVEPAARRRGAGTSLVEGIVAFARAAGSTELYLEVRLANQEAQRLYERSGFEIVGSRAEERLMRRVL